jgi:hypothetical protein
MPPLVVFFGALAIAARSKRAETQNLRQTLIAGATGQSLGQQCAGLTPD